MLCLRFFINHRFQNSLIAKKQFFSQEEHAAKASSGSKLCITFLYTGFSWALSSIAAVPEDTSSSVFLVLVLKY